MCRTFPLALGDQAQQWFRLLPQHSIRCWDDFAAQFVAQFISSKNLDHAKKRLVTIKQAKDEALREHLARFNKLIMEMGRISDNTMPMVIISSL